MSKTAEASERQLCKAPLIARAPEDLLERGGNTKLVCLISFCTPLFSKNDTCRGGKKRWHKYTTLPEICLGDHNKPPQIAANYHYFKSKTTKVTKRPIELSVAAVKYTIPARDAVEEILHRCSFVSLHDVVSLIKPEISTRKCQIALNGLRLWSIGTLPL